MTFHFNLLVQGNDAVSVFYLTFLEIGKGGREQMGSHRRIPYAHSCLGTAIPRPFPWKRTAFGMKLQMLWSQSVSKTEWPLE